MSDPVCLSCNSRTHLRYIGFVTMLFLPFISVYLMLSNRIQTRNHSQQEGRLQRQGRLSGDLFCLRRLDKDMGPAQSGVQREKGKDSRDITEMLDQTKQEVQKQDVSGLNQIYEINHSHGWGKLTPSYRQYSCECE